MERCSEGGDDIGNGALCSIHPGPAIDHTAIAEGHTSNLLSSIPLGHSKLSMSKLTVILPPKHWMAFLTPACIPNSYQSQYPTDSNTRIFLKTIFFPLLVPVQWPSSNSSFSCSATNQPSNGHFSPQISPLNSVFICM